MKAVWHGATLAQSDRTVVIEGNHYFPPDSIDPSYFLESQTHTICPWKGKASYKAIAVNGDLNADAAWYYPKPLSAAASIKDYFAFWRGVEVVED